MSSSKPYDPAKYHTGLLVRTAQRPELEAFMASWKLHNPLQTEQLAFSGSTAKVKASFMYHGGYVLYQLEGIPGIWHEQCLQPA